MKLRSNGLNSLLITDGVGVGKIYQQDIFYITAPRYIDVLNCNLPSNSGGQMAHGTKE